MKFMVSEVINCHLYFWLLLLACQILKVSRKYIIYETMVAICFIYYRITQRDACFSAFYKHCINKEMQHSSILLYVVSSY